MIIPKTSQDVEAVAEHYNELDLIYRKIWGLHLHHGLWNSGKETSEQAVVNLSRCVADNLSLMSPHSVLDIGCGYGETSRMFVDQWGVDVTAITASKFQYDYAKSLLPKNKSPTYMWGDFMKNSFSSEHFDRIFSIESSEHMVDKPHFFKETYRILRPQGNIVVCAWLSKENPSPLEEYFLLEPICREGRLPSLGSKEDYKQWMEGAGFKNFQFIDLSKKVKKTWSICTKRMCRAFFKDSEFRKKILSRDFKNRCFAKTVLRILAAYQLGSMQYGLIKAIK